MKYVMSLIVVLLCALESVLMAAPRTDFKGDPLPPIPEDVPLNPVCVYADLIDFLVDGPYTSMFQLYAELGDKDSLEALMREAWEFLHNDEEMSKISSYCNIVAISLYLYGDRVSPELREKLTQMNEARKREESKPGYYDHQMERRRACTDRLLPLIPVYNAHLRALMKSGRLNDQQRALVLHTLNKSAKAIYFLVLQGKMNAEEAQPYGAHLQELSDEQIREDIVHWTYFGGKECTPGSYFCTILAGMEGRWRSVDDLIASMKAFYAELH